MLDRPRRAWDATTGKVVWAFDGACKQSVFSGAGELLAAEAVPSEGETVPDWRSPLVYHPLVLCDSATGTRMARAALNRLRPTK